jgi:hypothetical protein
MHKNAMKCNETLNKWCKNKHGASKIMDTFETYQCFLSVFWLSTLHSINLWSCLPSSVFAWGQARYKLGGSWYGHFASLFCIIIYCYSLIYFIFKDDTYVISSIFTCSMIVGGFAAGVRILLEKDRQDTIFRKIRKILEKYQKIIFCQKTQEARRRSREEPGGRLTRRGRGLTPSHTGLLWGHPSPL